MFHRVKSELRQDSQENTTSDAPQQSQGAQGNKPQPQQAPQSSGSENMAEQNRSVSSEAQQGTPAHEEPSRPDAVPSSAFQKGPMPKTPSRPFTGGNFAGSSYASPSRSSEGEENERRLTIGRGITMSGEIEACDYLMVEGTVEAALKGARVVDITQSGTFYGTVDIEEATVAGRFEGDLTVHGRLVIRSGGVITGTVAYGELEVEAGAVIDGRLTPVSMMENKESAPASASSAPSAPSTSSRRRSSSSSNPEPANTDGELFEKAAAE